MKALLMLLLPLASLAAEAPAGTAPVPAPVPAAGLSLAEAYRLALKRSESVAIQAQALLQAGELETQAKGALLPTLSASANFLTQEQPTASVARQQNTVKATASQPLFRGFREFALLRSREALTAGEKAELANAARLLFYDVADAYYATLALQADQRNYGDELELNRKRLKELEGFRRVGRSRASEVLSQKANIASLEAQVEATLGQLKVQRDALAFLTGLPAETPLRDSEPAAAAGEKLDAYLAGVDSRADLGAARASVRASEAAVSVARGYHWPTADLTGNYYFTRPGSSSSINWDLGLTISLPIFEGGATQSRVREAVSVQEQATLRESLSRRQAELEVKRFFEQVQSGRARIEKLTENADLSRQNHEAQRREYANGLVTNLEVLQATTSWQVALRNLERQQFTLKSDYVKLQAAAGKREELKAVE